MKKLLAFSLLLSVFFLIASCGLKRVKGNGEIATSSRNVRIFNGIKSAGDFHVYIKQASEYKVSISTDRNLLDYIITEVEGDELVIRGERGKFLSATGPIKIYVTAPSFASLVIAGSGKITSEGMISTQKKMELKIAGSGDIVLEKINAPEVKGKIAGSGKIEISGETRDASYEIAGSGDLRCRGLKAESTRIKIAGSGDAWVYASNFLEASVAGSGDIHYYGNPADIKSNIAGSGKMIKE